MERISRHEMLLEMAVVAAKRSTCLRRKVGALAAIDGRPLVIGYAGAAHGDPHCTQVGCLIDSQTGACVRTQHAEANVIAFAARKGISLEGASLYCTTSPCLVCAKLILSAGIREVGYLEKYRVTDGEDYLLEHRFNCWGLSSIAAESLLQGLHPRPENAR